MRDKNYSSDVHEGKTLFLRNLHWEVDEEQLEEFINSKFGKTKYCKVVWKSIFNNFNDKKFNISN